MRLLIAGCCFAVVAGCGHSENGPESGVPAEPADLSATPDDLADGSRADDAGRVGQLGARCNRDEDCEQRLCFDGVCCDRACSGCSACNLPESVGRCAPIGDGSDPHHVCTEDCYAGCVAGACAIKPAGTPCHVTCTDHPADVSDSTYGTCDGTSAVCYYQYASCGFYRCASATACGTSCMRDIDCRRDAFCDGKACTGQRVVGDPCTRDWQCLSQRCAGGQCVGCISSSDCFVGAPICENGTCSRCTDDAACITAGTGIRCAFNVQTADQQCYCTDSSQCRTGRAPYCPSTNGSYEVCRCGLWACQAHQLCTTRDAQGMCRTNAGFPCLVDGECLSGTCNQGVCAPNRSGQGCMRGQDCSSGSCSADGICL